MKYHGRCHCSEVQFSVEAEIDCPIVCNCSFCKRRGATVQIVTHENFELTSGEDVLNQYGNKAHAKHNFCTKCGIHTFTRITEADGNKVAVNLNCIDEIDVTMLKPPMLFDGAAI